MSKIKGAPGAHISAAECTIFGGVLYIGRVHGAISGCTGKVRPVRAQNKSVISDTAYLRTLSNELLNLIQHRKKRRSVPRLIESKTLVDL